ncbi:MAG TPA: flagellar protein export ATPase FliI [Gammaproteobacteria bacterium]|nr:flagellar protein export ATPase FliI [Gammaproteobacteria bacterium]
MSRNPLPLADRNPIWRARLSAARQRVLEAPPPPVEGRLRRVAGLTLEAEGCRAALGSRCLVKGEDGMPPLETEVVGFEADRLYLMPVGTPRGIAPDARVLPLSRPARVRVGEGLLGRVIDGAGQPLDGKGPLRVEHSRDLAGPPINPLERRPIERIFDVGVRSINTLLTLGEGQRVGLFAGSGVGKSVLLGMMTRYAQADVIVVGLIGERGREVQEFVGRTLGPEAMQRAVVVAAPADAPPLMRLHGAWQATAIAEYFRDTGKRVLLLMDSLTRFAQAQREIGLAIGEPPATRGYPPSVFARLPQLVERAGNNEGPGSITAIYTVLAEGDDQNDPVVDSARAILDGHIVLARRIAESGIYPAIDIEASVSRVMNELISDRQREQVLRFRKLYAAYQRNRDMITLGAYQKGSDPLVDEAIARWPRMLAFLQQDRARAVSAADALAELARVLEGEAK